MASGFGLTGFLGDQEFSQDVQVPAQHTQGLVAFKAQFGAVARTLQAISCLQRGNGGFHSCMTLTRLPERDARLRRLSGPCLTPDLSRQGLATISASSR